MIWRPVWLLKVLQTAALSWAHVLGVSAFSLLVILVSLFVIGAGEPVKSRYRFALFPVLLSISGFTILLYSDYPPAQYALLGIVPLFTGLWLEILYSFWQRPDLYHPYTLQKVAGYFYLVELFLFVAALVGVQVLVQFPGWLMTLTGTVVFWLVQIDLLRLHQFDTLKTAVFALFGTILATELLVALNLLPTHFFMAGMLVALFFYAWLGIGKQFLLKEIDVPQITTYVVVSSLGSFLTIISSLWFT